MSEPTWTRRDVTFPSGEDDCAAWLYALAGQKPGAPAPIIALWRLDALKYLGTERNPPD